MIVSSARVRVAIRKTPVSSNWTRQRAREAQAPVAPWAGPFDSLAPGYIHSSIEDRRPTTITDFVEGTGLDFSSIRAHERPLKNARRQ